MYAAAVELSTVEKSKVISKILYDFKIVKFVKIELKYFQKIMSFYEDRAKLLNC